MRMPGTMRKSMHTPAKMKVKSLGKRGFGGLFGCVRSDARAYLMEGRLW